MGFSLESFTCMASAVAWKEFKNSKSLFLPINNWIDFSEPRVS